MAQALETRTCRSEIAVELGSVSDCHSAVDGDCRVTVNGIKISGGITLFAVAGLIGCGELLGPFAASLGGTVPGERGTVRVLFINNTPHRAVFTFGSFDPLDPLAQPDFGQFGIDDAQPVLDGGSSSEIITGVCARVFSIGSPDLLDRILRTQPGDSLDQDALAFGVQFLDVSDDGQSTLVGVAPPFEAELGFDFPCEALLILRFEIDDFGPDPFRTVFELIPSESTR